MQSSNGSPTSIPPASLIGSPFDLSAPHPSPIDAGKLPANAGIKLRRRGTTLLAFPQLPEGKGDMPVPPFELPQIYSSVIERAGGVCRAFFRLHRKSLCFLLYLDLNKRLWMDVPPPQFCSLENIRFNAGFGINQPPPDHYRLAGTLRSLPDSTEETAMEAVNRTPAVHGLHLVFDPASAWLKFHAFLFTEERGLERVAPGQVVLDEAEEYLRGLGDKAFVLDQLK